MTLTFSGTPFEPDLSSTIFGQHGVEGQLRTLSSAMFVPENGADLRVVGDAADGREALEWARRLRPDLAIVADDHLPLVGLQDL